MWVVRAKVCMGLFAAGGALVLAASPAGAKYGQFELTVDTRAITAGEILHMEAVVGPFEAEQAAIHPDNVPPVEVYRTEDLPASGGVPYIEPVQTVDWNYVGDGRFSGQVELAEPGSYQIVSMKLWNVDTGGYPEPISVTVTDPPPITVAVGSDHGLLSLWSAVVAVTALTALIAFGFARRRSNVIHAG